MSDAFSDTQQRFAHRIKDGRVCHTLLPTLNKFEKVSNSPAHRGELKTNPNILNLFWNRIPDISHVPMSLKETVAVEQSLTSASSPTTSHLIGGGLDSFPAREEASAHGLSSYLPVSKACDSVASCLNFKCSLRHPEEGTARLWSLFALRLVTCPYLRHILRPPRRRLHLVVHHILALWSREALLENFLDNLLCRDLLPLSDCSLARRAICASRRSPPQPTTTGRL